MSTKRKKTTRKGGPDVTTIAGLLAWLRPRLDSDQKSRGALEAACWAAAYWESQSMLEMFTAKDLASVIQDGLPGIKTRADLARWLGQTRQEFDSKDDMRRELLGHLYDMGYEP